MESSAPFFERWLHRPQTTFLRKAMFQVHLWTGLALGLYLVMLSVTGSALVYRNELDRYFATPRPAFDAAARPLAQALAQSIGQAVVVGVRSNG